MMFTQTSSRANFGKRFVGSAILAAIKDLRIQDLGHFATILLLIRKA
jgi:hypothetical protein